MKGLAELNTTNVTVIGTILIDCKGFSETVYRPKAKNLGSVRFVHGGVGRNVAENLARLGMRVSMISSVNQDGNGKAVVEHLNECGVNTEYVMPVPEKGMGFWLAVLDEEGNLVGSISDMPDLTSLARMIEQKGEEIVRAATHIVLVLDLNEQLTKQVLRLAQEQNKPVFGLPSNFGVIEAHPEVLDGLDCFVCNEIEAAKLFDSGPFVKLEREEQFRRMKTYVNQRSIRRMVITLGSEGAVYFDASSGEASFYPASSVQLVDSSGAGDAFFSGTVLGLVNGKELAEAVAIGTRLAAWTIEDPESCCPTLGERAAEDAFVRDVIRQNLQGI